MRLLLLPVWLYLGLWGVAVAYAIYKEATDPSHSEFAGLPLIVLGLPWSIVWHDFNPKVVESQYHNSIIVESAFISLNVAIMLLVVIALGARTRKSEGEPNDGAAPGRLGGRNVKGDPSA